MRDPSALHPTRSHERRVTIASGMMKRARNASKIQLKSRYNEPHGAVKIFRYNGNFVVTNLNFFVAFRIWGLHDFRNNGIFRCIGIRCNGILLILNGTQTILSYNLSFIVTIKLVNNLAWHSLAFSHTKILFWRLKKKKLTFKVRHFNYHLDIFIRILILILYWVFSLIYVSVSNIL